MPVELLRRAIRTDKVVHSYLFVGNEGIGKKMVALQFGKALNCLGEEPRRGDACESCKACKKIQDGLHPDILLIEPENQILRIDQVREMQRHLAYRPYEGKRRVCILAATDRMAPHMSNILLKTLEEPPLHTVIILLANNPRLLLPTILSRCQIVRFHPVPMALISKWLEDRKGVGKEEAHLLASLSEGSPGRALEFREEIPQIPRGTLLKEWLGRRTFPFDVIDRWAESMPSERGNLVTVLEVAKTLLRDVVVAKTVRDDSRLTHFDLKEEIHLVASTFSLSMLLKRLDTLHRTLIEISPIRGNANTRLSVEAMMLSWAEG